MAGDLDTLLDMGFDKERAELAVKQSGGLQGAIDWLERNQDKDIEELKEEQGPTTTTNSDGLQPGEVPMSLVCNDCGKKFRSQDQAEFHASKTEHMNFSESTEEIAPLSPEEKAARLEELRAKLAEKRAGQSVQDKIDKKRNDEIKRKATREESDIREELQRKEKLKEAEKKKRERLEDIEAKKRIQAKIAADKEERRRKAAEEKAAKEGQTLPAERAPAAPEAPSQPKPASSYTEARLRLQTPAGTVQKTLPAETTLFELAHAIKEEKGLEVSSFQSNYPKKTFDQGDFGMTLKEAGFVPSAALVVK